MEHLIPMTDFVIYQYEKLKNKEINTLDYAFNTGIYAHFLKKPLKLGYFIPCDENDKPLEEPINFKIWEKLHFNNGKSEKGTIGFKEHEKYQEAKQRVLFEGFEYDKENDWVTYNEFARFFVSELQNGKVEDLFKLIKDEITLTETSKKEIGIL